MSKKSHLFSMPKVLSANAPRTIIVIALVVASGLLLWETHATIQAKVALQQTAAVVQSNMQKPKPVLPYVYSRVSNPAQTIVTDQKGTWLATFTDASYTVRLAGSVRTFAEPSTTSAKVTHNTWVRTLPKPFDGKVDETWLTTMLADEDPDVLAVSMQYITKAPAIMSNGVQIAGDASYGPVNPKGKPGSREPGADFNDYLGIDWPYPNGKTDHPEPTQAKSMDCSGYMRMIWGYRAGLPLAPALPGTSDDGNPQALPRRAAQIQNASPGIVLIADTDKQVMDFAKLRIGDIVFFDANKADGKAIDHVGMFLGTDNQGHLRFISSRQTADGPTMGDVGGKSVLDGSGHYASAFRAARRF